MFRSLELFEFLYVKGKKIPLKIYYMLRRRANARNVSFRISLRWLTYIVNSVDKTKLSET